MPVQKQTLPSVLMTSPLVAATFLAGVSYPLNESRGRDVFTPGKVADYRSSTLGKALDLRESLSARFARLAAKWRKEVRLLSSAFRMAEHPAYKEIIEMKWAAIPLILNEMRARPHHWFWALCRITGEDPVKSENAGNIPKMTEDWIEWGKKHRFING